jgi:Uma2 family endonuclease
MKEVRVMMALSHDPSMSVEEYLQLDRSSIETRYEYIDGYVSMLAGGTLDHATIGANIISILRHSMRGTPCRVFTSDARVRLSSTRFVYPDASVSCDEQDRGQSDNLQSPRLVVEVLSPSTEGYDRGRKFGFYRECPTIQDYLLIDSQRPMLEVYRRERHDLWILRAYRMDEDVELTNLGVHFPVSAVYEDVMW